MESQSMDSLIAVCLYLINKENSEERIENPMDLLRKIDAK